MERPRPYRAHLAGLAGLLLAMLAPTVAAAQEASPPPRPPRRPGPTPEEVAMAVESLYGPAIRDAKATPTKEDDLEMASRLLDAARPGNHPPALTGALAAEAADLAAGAGATGHATAVAALELWIDAAPDGAAEPRAKLVDLYQAAYVRARGAAERADLGRALLEALLALADAEAETYDTTAAVAALRRAQGVARAVRSPEAEVIQARLRHAVTRQRIQARTEALAEAVAADAADAEARRTLVRLILIELDAPERAAEHLAPDADDVESKLVLLAAMTPDRLPERAALRLAEWYEDLAADATPPAEPTMLERATLYYGTFLAKHTAADAERQKAEVALAAVEEKLRDLAEVGRTARREPQLVVLTRAEFDEKLGKRMPPEWNRARGGRAVASSQYADRDPQNVFAGTRTGNSWTLSGPAGWFEARWSPPVRGRYLVLFGRTSTPGADPWGAATMAVNGGKPVPIPPFSGSHVLVADFGASVSIRALRLAIQGRTYPGLAAIEIHR